MAAALVEHLKNWWAVILFSLCLKRLLREVSTPAAENLKRVWIILFLNAFKEEGKHTGEEGDNVPLRTMTSSLVVLKLQNFLFLHLN